MKVMALVGITRCVTAASVSHGQCDLVACGAQRKKCRHSRNCNLGLRLVVIERGEHETDGASTNEPFRNRRDASKVGGSRGRLVRQQQLHKVIARLAA